MISLMPLRESDIHLTRTTSWSLIHTFYCYMEIFKHVIWQASIFNQCTTSLILIQLITCSLQLMLINSQPTSTAAVIIIVLVVYLPLDSTDRYIVKISQINHSNDSSSYYCIFFHTSIFISYGYWLDSGSKSYRTFSNSPPLVADVIESNYLLS